MNFSVDEMALMTFSVDHLTYEEAIKSLEWKKAMDQELSIEKNHTWTLCSLPKEAGVKRVHRTKYNEHANLEKLKARLVAKSYSQQYSVDYTEVFAPVVMLDTVRIMKMQ